MKRNFAAFEPVKAAEIITSSSNHSGPVAVTSARRDEASDEDHLHSSSAQLEAVNRMNSCFLI
jgi:hypothetical protein